MKKIVISLYTLLFIITTFKAEDENNYYFKKIDLSEGLSQSTIFNIIQDHKGYLWFGTADGLNRYDGYNFRVYVTNPLDSSSISDNGISSIHEDKEGNIWIGTINGVLNKLDRRTDKFHRYYITDYPVEHIASNEKYYDYPIPFSRNNNKTITSIDEDDNGNLWIGTWNKGLIRFNIKEESYKSFVFQPNETSISSNKIMDILVDHLGVIWIGTFGSGLDRLNYTNDSKYAFRNYSELSDSKNSLSNNEIIKILQDKDYSIWIGTYGGGANRFEYYNMNEPLFRRVCLGKDNVSLLGSNTIMDIIQDRSGFLWFGTFGGGITRFDKQKNSFERFTYNPNKNNSLIDDDVLSIYEDASGIIWIGTHLGKGISKLEKNTVKFESIKYDPSSSFGLPDNVVWAIYEDENILWIGTYRQGLIKYDLKKGIQKVYKSTSDNKVIGDDHVRSIEKDNFGNLIIGTYKGGLNIFDPVKEKSIVYQYDAENQFSISSNQIQDILLLNDTLWLATFGGGLCYAPNYTQDNLTSLKFYSLKNIPGDPSTLSDNRIYKLLHHNNNIWIGSFGGGLNQFNMTEKIFYRYQNNPSDFNSLSDDRVISLNSLNDSIIYVGTYGGNLNEFNLRTGKFKRFTERDGFTSHVIYGLVIDNNQSLWASSDDGLFKYYPKEKIVGHYDIQDGLQSLEFSGGAYYKSPNGRIYFGGVNGLNYFHPDSITVNNYIPPLVISSFKIFNNELKGERDSITLTYDQNFFSFEFAALDYTNPSENMYEYILEGFDKNWRSADSEYRIAHYTNLPPGDYKFKVIGSNNDGVWNKEGSEIYLTILPPFWQTWWFISVAVILIGGFIYFISTVRYRNLLAIEKVKSKLAADLHDNVGAGLTEISILTELAASEVKETSSDFSNRLKNVSEIARQLVDNMSDIVWFINPKRDSLHDLIVRLKDFYSDFLSQTGVAFKTININKIKNIKLPMDYRQNLYLILKEGINNSIKHSRCNKIELKANLRGDYLELIIKDDGIGFDINNHKSGNGLINMKERAEKIGGRIKCNSSKDKGTSLTFLGKISRLHKLKAKLQV